MENQLTEDFFLDLVVDDERKKKTEVCFFLFADGCDALFMTFFFVSPLIPCFFLRFAGAVPPACFALLHSWALMRSAIRKRTFFFLFSYSRSNGRGCGRDGRIGRVC